MTKKILTALAATGLVVLTAAPAQATHPPSHVSIYYGSASTGLDRPFLMPIEDVFTVTDGSIRPGDLIFYLNG